MTAADLKHWADTWWAPLIPLGIATAFFVWLIWWVVSPLGGHYEARVKLCDRMVPVLLHSKDMTEVVRAGILVHELDCGISSRAARETE